MGTRSNGKAVKIHFSSKMARELIVIFQLCTIDGSWFISEFFFNYTSPTSPSSSSQDSLFDVNRYTENPVPETSRSVGEELRGDPQHESTETGNKNQKEESEVQRDMSHELPGWLQEFRERIWLMKILQQSLGETQSKEVETLPMNFQSSLEQKWNRVRVSTVYVRTFRRIRIVEYAWRRKLQGPRAEDAMAEPYSVQKFWWLDNSRSQGPKRQLRITQQSSICCGGARRGHPMDPVISVQNKNFTRNPEEPDEVRGADEES